MLKRTATRESPYAYEVSGLKNLFLYGIDVYRCSDCAVESPMIPRIAQLHRLITKHLLRKDGLLSGDQVRFLRRNAGLPAKNLAALLGVTPSHLSKVENGKHPHLGAAADRLVRAFAAVSVCGESSREALLMFSEKGLASQRRARTGRTNLFFLRDNRWHQQAA